MSFVQSRLRQRAASEDVVQETFIGFLTSLPNYDTRRPLESYLFSIAAHKLTDYLRREGRRPVLPLSSTSKSDGGAWDMPGTARPASSIARSGERRGLEEEAVAQGITEQIENWRSERRLAKDQVHGAAIRARGGQQGGRDGSSASPSSRWPISSSILSRGCSRSCGSSVFNEDVFPELYADEHGG